MNATVVVMAKEPVPGRAKTRLCPPCSPEQAARIAEAALADTLVAVTECGARRRILVLDGNPGTWLPPGFAIVEQCDGRLDERLEAAWSGIDGPAIQIGMDTPQVTPRALDEALEALGRCDAVLGPALDGGWWCVGFATTPTGAFRDVRMSRTDTGARQHARLTQLGLDVRLLDPQRDIDSWADAVAVASTRPSSRTAAAVAAVAAAHAASAA
jgi:rSAM/selenodomain-associated transferase 1